MKKPSSNSRTTRSNPTIVNEADAGSHSDMWRAANTHAVMWRTANHTRQASSGLPLTRLDGLEAMAALILLLVYEHDHRHANALAELEVGTQQQAPLPRVENLMHQVPPHEWHRWLKHSLFEALDRSGNQDHKVVQRWLDHTHLSAEAVQLAVSVFEPGSMDLASYSDQNELPVHLIEAPFQSIEQAAGRSELWPTPFLLARYMVDLVDPKPGDRIYNPGSGTGSLLLAAWKHLKPQFQQLSIREQLHIQTGSFYGLEANFLSAFISLARLKLAGLSGPNLEVGNVLTPPFKTGFDVVLCDPPFGGNVSLRERGAQGSASLDAAFLDHVLNSLAPGGRAVMTVPSALLFRGGLNRELRRRLCEEFRLEAVLELPPGTWATRTIKANLLIIKRASPRLTVGFVDASVSQQFVKAPRDPGWEQVEIRDVLSALDRGRAPDVVATHVHHIPTEEIAQNDWILEIKRYQREQKQDVLNDILSAVPQARIAALEEVATIFKGRSNWTKEGTGLHTTGIPIYRISDVANARTNDDGVPEVATCREFLSPTAEKSVADQQWLHGGDILMTIDGTVGKIAAVGKGDVKAVAGQGLAVIRCEGDMDRQFLLSLLRTEPYQDMINRLRAGSVISHLRLGDLRKLPVPVLPLEHQKRLRAAKAGQSATTLLALLREDAVFSFWERILLDSPHVAQLVAFNDDEISSPSAIQALRALVDEELNPHRDEIKAMLDNQFPAVREFSALAKRAKNLQDIVSMHDGADKALVLQVWRQNQSAMNVAQAEGISRAVAERMAKVHDALVKLSRHEWERLLSESTLKASVAPQTLKPNVPQEVTLIVENTSNFPLIGIEMRVPHLNAAVAEPFLSAGKTLSVTVKFTPVGSDQVTWSIPWKAKRVDLIELTGELEVVMRLDVTTEGVETSIKRKAISGSNPYVTGISLNEQSNRFYGRDDVSDEIKSLLRLIGPATVLILEGVRRVGKTSLLKQFLRPEMLPGWLPVYYDFQTADGASAEYGVPTADIFSNILRETLLACHHHGISVPMRELPEGAFSLSRSQLREELQDAFVGLYQEADAPFALFVGHMEQVVGSLAGKRLLLMLDEFDKTQAGIENGVTSPQIAENFRSLFHSHPEISAILTGSQLMKRLRGEYFHPLFGIGRAIPINELDRASALKLVTDPAKGVLHYRNAACDYIVDQAACQPFIIQHICSQVFSLCLRSKDSDVTLEVAEHAARRFMEDQTHFGQVWKEDISDPRAQFLTVLINELDAGRQPLTAEWLRESLAPHGIKPSKRFSDFLETLCNLHVVRRQRDSGKQTYHIAMPLFATWLTEHEDVSECAARVINEHDATL